MRTSLFFLGLILVCAVLVERIKREEQRVPRTTCRNGIMDNSACGCRCSFVGQDSYRRFCMATRTVCALRGRRMSGHCCDDYRLRNLANSLENWWYGDSDVRRAYESDSDSDSDSGSGSERRGGGGGR